MKIEIKMYSDYICPFCYLGEAIIEKLQSRFNIEMEHIGIEIHPETPEEGVDLRGRIYGIEEMYENLRARGKEYGLNFCDIRLLSSSRKALIIGEFARKVGKNAEFTHEVFKAYFEGCLDIGKEAVIIEIAQKVGLTKKEVEDCLKNPMYQNNFANNCAEARKHDINGVPTFIINDIYRITGAQPEEKFIELFEQMSNGKSRTNSQQ
ncbi:MAG TPA: DsbA family protein [Candidatus Nanoarchaeia archaeon]|nr:DsbA family protein [Candidatus Nanoarchaeia archaeon]